MTDLVEEGLFVWWHDNIKTLYTDWGPGQPDDYTENCGVLYSSYDEKWIDAPCWYTYYPICEGNERF